MPFQINYACSIQNAYVLERRYSSFRTTGVCERLKRHIFLDQSYHLEEEVLKTYTPKGHVCISKISRIFVHVSQYPSFKNKFEPLYTNI